MNKEYKPYTPGPSGPVRDCTNVDEIASQRPKLAPRIQVPAEVSACQTLNLRNYPSELVP